MAAMFFLIDQNKQMAQETGAEMREEDFREALDMASTQISLEKLILCAGPCKDNGMQKEILMNRHS